MKQFYTVWKTRIFPPSGSLDVQVTLMQSVKGKVQSAAEGTNYSEPGMTFNGWKCWCPQVLTNKTGCSWGWRLNVNILNECASSISFIICYWYCYTFCLDLWLLRLEFGILDNPRVDSKEQLAFLSWPDMRRNMSQLLQSKKALEKGLAESRVTQQTWFQHG